ncbi:unnamed protein product [Oppiella nova]|uniref:UTP--glucose-1-phosphate uridylyltransferase n=2 Tax=Oppiella nova TaxID=334625 RepID=A0A7R9M618_9ACAR|nr:unnamed protein product [Oppiella nova]CAG2171436.1 unnamed protein product [Oppiella nova]
MPQNVFTTLNDSKWTAINRMTNESTNGAPLAVGNQTRHQRKVSSTTEFKELTKRDAQHQLAQELDKLLRTANANSNEKSICELEFKGFQQLYMKYLQGVGPSVQWEKIEPLPEDAVRSYGALKSPQKDAIRQMLNQLVVVKLNGGLGTVIIIANHGDRIDIPSGAILESKIVSGNLRILDH